MTTTSLYRLFQVFGVELEYMIVDADTLNVCPITDHVLHEVAGAYLSEVDMGQISWSNELALHVLELKTNGPARTLAPLAQQFQNHVQHINRLLRPQGAQLMPTAMHPWMDPDRELKLWPHEYNPVYEAYHRIFDCRGHGWANLQSVHLNLPFANDEEFGRLHAAIRLLLPIMPALAASSPVAEGNTTDCADFRLEVYRHNSDRVPLVAAQVIPEPVFTQAEYERLILKPMYEQIAPLDPEGTLQHEWLNARGAIARFDRQTIEVRVLDMQECPAADLAVCAVITEVLRALTGEQWTRVGAQQAMGTEPLQRILLNCIRDADFAIVEDADYLRQLGIHADRLSAGDIWRSLVSRLPSQVADNPALAIILQHGCLARRIERALGGDVRGLKAIYRELCDCLEGGRMFLV